MNHEKKVIRQYLKEEIAFSRTQGLTITGESLRAEFGSPEEMSTSACPAISMAI